MKVQYGSGLMALLACSALLIFTGIATAADGSPSEVPITINAGETYVIKNLAPNGTPAVHVVKNPDALIIHAETPGQLVLLGTSAGTWTITANTSDGQKITYNVTVNAVGSPFLHPLAPAKAPRVMGEGSASSSDVGGAGALDAGSGPVSHPSIGPAHTAADNSTAGAEATAVSYIAPVAAAQASAGANQPAETPVMPSQQASGEIPLRKFKSDPLALRPPSAMVVNGGHHYLPNDVISLMKGTSEIFDFPHRIRRVSIADTDIADLQVVTPYQINLIGHKPGFTTLAVWDVNGTYQEREIRVDPFGKQQVLLNVIVAELNKSRLEAQGINWTASLPNYNVSLVSLAGGVATPYTPTSALTTSTILGAGTPTQTLVQSTVQGALPPGGMLIPLLLSQNLSYGLTAGNSNVQTQTFFQFMEQHGLAKILAEPHLLANSGEKAQFLSGGEIPIVIAQALNTSVVFKQFGTSVIFVPTVVGRNDIELEVEPEVSEPDYAHGVQLFGFTVPAFVTRRAQTWVRLKNNQTLIIAGLILHTKTSTVDKTPYLGDIPYLGMLFKNTEYQDQESDLVMSVTPQLVRALPESGAVALPTDRPPLSESEIQTHRLSVPDASRPRF
ncbi:MAG: type II and III secretion system protein family protein [Candidatus Binataceae bacterium]